jgi:hypothetical protein
MFNLVELCADDDEQIHSPCAHGNIVAGHACYCHKAGWPDGPRKCPVWREFNVQPEKWHNREWPLTEHVKSIESFKDGTQKVTTEMWRSMPDDGLGGCPMFEPSPPTTPGEQK